jgi:fatty-acyl-CoA synthase
MENHPRFLEIIWGTMRSGLYLTAVNRHLGVEETRYIVDDCDAQVLITTHTLGAVAAELPEQLPVVERFLMLDEQVPGYEAYEATVSSQSAEPLRDEPLGHYMLYSSGSTGQPKGIIRPLSGQQVSQGQQIAADYWGIPARVDESSVLLITSPLYHSAPFTFSYWTQMLGGTIVVQESFDARQVLELIERYRVTHVVLVPTMFVRMLKLEPEERHRFDLSSLRVAVHGAAPCPVEIKHAMIDWWGPIIEEYYGGTEDVGQTYIRSDEWLAHPGSVGKAEVGTVHIMDEVGTELAPGEIGGIYFDGPRFDYHKDPDKTASVYLADGKSTLGDIGYMDEEGYLYLVDRKDYMIISGGVNIYPREIEDRLILHAAVADVAVFGIPHAEYGEEVKAVVEPVEGVTTGPELARELIDYCRQHIAHFKCPRSVDFDTSLPREPTGKLYKRKLKARYP